MTVAPGPNAGGQPIDRPSSLKDSAYRAIKDRTLPVRVRALEFQERVLC
jgi:hypothetical protein